MELAAAQVADLLGGAGAMVISVAAPVSGAADGRLVATATDTAAVAGVAAHLAGADALVVLAAPVTRAAIVVPAAEAAALGGADAVVRAVNRGLAAAVVIPAGPRPAVAALLGSAAVTLKTGAVAVNSPALADAEVPAQVAVGRRLAAAIIRTAVAAQVAVAGADDPVAAAAGVGRGTLPLPGPAIARQAALALLAAVGRWLVARHLPCALAAELAGTEPGALAAILVLAALPAARGVPAAEPGALIPVRGVGPAVVVDSVAELLGAGVNRHARRGIVIAVPIQAVPVLAALAVRALEVAVAVAVRVAGVVAAAVLLLRAATSPAAGAQRAGVTVVAVVAGAAALVAELARPADLVTDAAVGWIALGVRAVRVVAAGPTAAVPIPGTATEAIGAGLIRSGAAHLAPDAGSDRAAVLPVGQHVEARAVAALLPHPAAGSLPAPAGEVVTTGLAPAAVHCAAAAPAAGRNPATATRALVDPVQRTRATVVVQAVADVQGVVGWVVAYLAPGGAPPLAVGAGIGVVAVAGGPEPVLVRAIGGGWIAVVVHTVA